MSRYYSNSVRSVSTIRATPFLLVAFALLLPRVAGAVPTVPVDLSTWVVEDYPTLGGNGSWIVSGAGNEIATQLNNADVTLFLSNGQIDVSVQQAIRGTLRVNGGDDDNIGFVFAYQNRGQMYLFSWKQNPQDSALKGMGVILLDTGSPSLDPTRNDFSLTTLPSSAQTVLMSNDVGWVTGTEYTYDLLFGTGEFRITISDGVTTLIDWQVTDSTFTAGDFGFFNLSNPNTVYSALVPEPSTALLLGSGLLALAAHGRRRKA